MAMTNAERQRRFREKHKIKSVENPYVCLTVNSEDTIETMIEKLDIALADFPFEDFLEEYLASMKPRKGRS